MTKHSTIAMAWLGLMLAVGCAKSGQEHAETPAPAAESPAPADATKRPAMTSAECQVKGGTVVGTTDEIGYAAAENPVHVYDLHATALHLLGLDHTLLTYFHGGREQRLTDVHGRIVSEMLA